jgi:hypothetical protein
MSISMHQAAHYVTQSSIYDCPKLGRLTDRAIAKYKKLGFYSTGFIEERHERQKRKANKGKSRQQLTKETLKQLLENFT